MLAEAGIQLIQTKRMLLRHCEPEGRGNLIAGWDCFASLAMTPKKPDPAPGGK
jgi:hypothetical protein